MTHMHLQDIEAMRAAVLFTLALVCVFIFWVNGRNDDDDGPGATGARVSRFEPKPQEF